MSLRIFPVLCNKGFMDNYSYIIEDEETKTAAIIDASEEKAITDQCSELGVVPSYLLITHHHEDHTNATIALKNKYNLKVVGSDEEKNKIPAIDIALQDNEKFYLGNSEAQIILTQGHTNGHILWYFANDSILFTGDVLFNLCIGGLFEGTPEQMWNSLQKIKSLPDDIKFYPGHEYTMFNINSLRTDNTDCNEYLKFITEKRRKNEPIVGITLGLEKKCNPYLKISSKTEFTSYFRG